MSRNPVREGFETGVSANKMGGVGTQKKLGEFSPSLIVRKPQGDYFFSSFGASAAFSSGFFSSAFSSGNMTFTSALPRNSCM